MTARAQVSQTDIERTLKACKRAGYERARVHINLAAQTIDIMLGDEGLAVPASPRPNPWDKELE